DVDTVIAGNRRHERLATLDKRRKEAPLDAPGGGFRAAIEGGLLRDPGARVDRVARDFVRLWLFEKPEDVSLRVRFHQAVRAGIVHRRQHYGGLGAARAVEVHDGPEVDLREHVTVEHHQRVVHAFAGEAHAARRP